MALRRFVKKSYTQIRDSLFNSSNSAEEMEKMIVSLTNDDNPEAITLLIDFLLSENISQPNPLLNYKGETITGLKLQIIDSFTNSKLLKDIEIKKVLFNVLKKFYTFEELRRRIFSLLKLKNYSTEGAQLVLNLIWSESVPIEPAKLIMLELLVFLPKNEQSNHLYWFLFTPDFVTQEFPKHYHSDVYDHLCNIHGENAMFLMMVQALYAELSKPVNHWQDYLGQYLEFTEETLNYLYSNITTLKKHENKQDLVTNLQNILKLVFQADDESFLRLYNPKAPESITQHFLELWKFHIESRFSLRFNILNLLCELGDQEACDENQLIHQSKKYKTSDHIKPVIREIEETFENPITFDLLTEIVQNIKMLTEILEWKFVEILPDLNFSRFDLIEELLKKMPKLVDLFTEDMPPTIKVLLLNTSQEAVRQYNARKEIVDQLLMNKKLTDQFEKREEKYLKMASDPPHKLQVQINVITDLILKQKRRLSEFMFAIDQNALRQFIEKLNEVLSRILNYPKYYVSFKTFFQPSENPLTFKEDIKISDVLIQFYRYFEEMVEESKKQKPITLIGLRRIESVMDLINDYISQMGLIDFDTEYYNTEDNQQ